MADLSDISSAPRAFVLAGPVSFMSVLAVAVLQLTMIAIVFLIFYYYWFAVAITNVQGLAGGNIPQPNIPQQGSLNRNMKSIFGLNENGHGQGRISQPWRNPNESNQDDDAALAARVHDAIQRGKLLNSE